MILSRPVATSFTLGVQAALFLLALLSMSAHAVDWPQEVAADEGVIVVYQPQPDSLKGNTLTGRSAMSKSLRCAGPIRKTPVSSALPRWSRAPSRKPDSRFP